MWEIIVTSVFLGIGLAMDACAVSMSNGLKEPDMKMRKTIFIAITFAVFQAFMPMIGWICVTLVVDKFTAFEKFVPYIAFVLLSFIGGKMLYDGFKTNSEAKNVGEIVTQNSENKTAIEHGKNLTCAALLIQAVATSIDALSAGFSLSDIAGANVWSALLCCGIIAVITFGISLGGVYLGKKFGDKLGSKAEILGGFVLIAIGLEILIKGIWF